MKQKKRMKEGLIPADHNTSPLSQHNNTDSNGSLDHPTPPSSGLDHAKSESPGPQ